jgi:hypothetical protein
MAAGKVFGHDDSPKESDSTTPVEKFRDTAKRGEDSSECAEGSEARAGVMIRENSPKIRFRRAGLRHPGIESQPPLTTEAGLAKTGHNKWKNLLASGGGRFLGTRIFGFRCWCCWQDWAFCGGSNELGDGEPGGFNRD